jgi:hypothetical protein|tara:strand:- start:358 stop:534 length:177 start_codon:yes stop_codon:yes gene_type:complete
MGAITNDLKALVALDTILIGAKYFYLIPASFFVGSKFATACALIVLTIMSKGLDIRNA